MVNTTRKKKESAVHLVSLCFAEIQEFFIKPYSETDPEKYRVPGATYYQLVKLRCGLVDYQHPHARTFVRKDAQPINGKYLYIFRSSSPHPAADQLAAHHRAAHRPESLSGGEGLDRPAGRSAEP